MDRRFLTVLGVSLLFALVISSVFYQMTARAGNSKKAEPPQELRDVVVAAKPLSVGTMVKPTDIKLAKLPAVAFPKGAFAKAEEVIDRPVISNILMDEPLLEGRLAARGGGLGLAPIIPVGMRAVTVRVNDVSGISGFVLPGMRVDILVTGNPPAGGGIVTVTPLQNMLVLSAGTAVQPDAKGQAIPAATVTLLATPEQAEMLTLANNEGRIQLVLRNGSDQNVERVRGSEVAELYGGLTRKKAPETPAAPRPRPRPVETAVVAAPAPPPPPPPPDQIVVIRGTQKSIEVVGVGGR
ncbi:MAG TPA: Flp pilus assembly protein CpaB [Bryobacteraceae bacterium]|nr:Flp pilus assembly protein CpaB [Bryobacteraceae bacterium]